MKLRLLAAAAALALAAATSPVSAQTWPDRPIKMLIPLAPGSAVDSAVRIVAEKMGDILGQKIVPENQPGASGLIGMRTGARATPDGYTILGVNDSILAMLPNLKPASEVGYDPLTDFAPITQVVTINFALVGHSSFAPSNLKEFIAAAKANPGAINYGSGGPGSPQHVGMEMLMHAAGIKLTHVPYRGVTFALNDVVAGQVPTMIVGLPAPLAFAEQGKLKIIGTTARERLKVLPNSPSIAEQGLAGYDFTTWGAMVAPAKTPPQILARLNEAAVAAIRDPAISKRLTGMGYDIVANSPEDFAARLKAHHKAMADIIRAANIKID